MFMLINTNNEKMKNFIGKVGNRLQGKIGSHEFICFEDGRYIETSTIQDIEKHDGFCCIKTHNSYYEFERIEENPFKKYFLVVTVTTNYDYDISTEVWASGCRIEKSTQYGEDYWILYKNETIWFDTPEEKENHKRIREDVPIIKEGTWIFDESFLEFCKKAGSKIHDSGEFAFNYRKKLRKQFRDEICSKYTGLARKNCLSYFKQYC